MTEQLRSALKRLVNESRADAALVSGQSRAGEVIALGGYPGTLLNELPSTPATTRSVPLDGDLTLTVVWCDPAASTALTGEQQRQALAEVTAVAQLSKNLDFAEGEVERLRAAINGLQDGVVTVNPSQDLAAVNATAAALLGLTRGEHPLRSFDSALARLVGRVLNLAEVRSCITLLESDPTASIECMWRFPTAPTHLYVVSQPVENQRFRGRTWVFYDESESAQALESLERANAQFRASADGMLEPQALLKAVRDAGGKIVDFVYHDVNRATCAYLSMTRDQLVGRSVLETMPTVKSSGLLARFTQCAEARIPVILDEFSYDNDILDGPRYYDISATPTGGDFVTLTWRDVTERVDSAKRIAQSEEHFRLLAENVGDVVVHVRDGIIAWVSPSVEDALGAPPAHWIGRSLMDIIPEADRQAHEKVIWLSDDRAVIPRGRVKTIDGQTHWVHVHARAFYEDDGTPDGYTASFRVIDDEVRAVEQAELADQRQAEADARYRRLMDSSAVPMCVTTPEGRFEEVNDAMCRYFGYQAEALRTMTWMELAAPEYRQSDADEFAGIITGKADTHRGVKEFLHADGHRIWGDLSVSCLRKPNGEVESIIAQIIDITEQIRIQRIATEAARKEDKAQARYRNLMDNAAVAMVVIEPDGRLEEVNRAACEFVGYDAATLTQMTWQELTPPEYMDADLVNVENMAAGKTDSFRLTKQFIHADGHRIWADLSVGCLRGPNGELDRMIAQVSDITNEVETREFLARRDEQNRILTARLQAKSERLSAELRSAASYVESILPGDLTGPVSASSRYLPSRELGGDCFDYRWIDDDHLVAYIIDVSGHGIEASMVSISVYNLLRSTTLVAANLADPAAVLAKLNTVITMERHSDNYLTAWYCVYEQSSRTVRYASAGHPPALLFTPGDGAAGVTQLAARGLPVGMFDDGEYTSAMQTVPPGSQLLLYSDGAYELPTLDGGEWTSQEFAELYASLARSPGWSLDMLIDQLRTRTATGQLNDDCSLVRLTFN